MIINWTDLGQYKTFFNEPFPTANGIIDWGYFPVGSSATPPPSTAKFRRTLSMVGTRIGSRQAQVS